MFINCPGCSALVATDLATDLPPAHCPRCGFGLRADQDEPQPPLPPGDPCEADPPATAPESGPAPAQDAARGSDPPEPSAAPAPAADDAAARTAPAGRPLQSAPPPVVARRAPAASPAGPVRARPAPPFLHRRRGANAGPGWRGAAAVAALAALLAGQLLLADRPRLAADAGWRPILAGVCGLLRCSLPPWREPAAIAMQQRDIRPLPGHPGVLRVSASIRNDARWPQAWPVLVLTLSDADGRALGVRAFQPAEYLGGPPPAATLGSGEGAAIGMDIVEPSPHAVAFDFRFH